MNLYWGTFKAGLLTVVLLFDKSIASSQVDSLMQNPGKLSLSPQALNEGSAPSIEITNHKDFKLYRQEVDSEFKIEFSVYDSDGDEVTYFNLQRYMKPHFPTSAANVAAAAASK